MAAMAARASLCARPCGLATAADKKCYDAQSSSCLLANSFKGSVLLSDRSSWKTYSGRRRMKAAASHQVRNEQLIGEAHKFINPFHVEMAGGQMRSGPRDLDPSSMLLRQRIIFLGGQVDDNSADLVISQLLLLDTQDPTKDIKLFINSPGGSVTAGMGIYDAMKLCRADVSTICFGLAASMGAFLLCAGTRGKRFCMPNARVMIHQPLGGIGGSATDVGLQMREMMYHKLKLNKIMARLSGKTEQQIEADTDRDYFMDAWEAMEYGLVDGIIDADKPDLVAPRGIVAEPPKAMISEAWVVREGRERRSLPSEDLAGKAS